MPISAVDTISLAFQHTKRQLIQPFRFWQWTRLAFVGLLAGEMGSGGGFNFPSSFNPPQHGSTRHFLASPFSLPQVDPGLLAALIFILVFAGLILFFVLLYVNSVMRFILFDSVLMKQCHVRAGWSRRQEQGWRYFLWQLGFSFAIFSGVAVLIGLPAGLAYGAGWFNPPGDHIVPLVLTGIVVFGMFFLFFISAAVIGVFTKDFVIPQMALEGIGALEGWRRLWPMIQLEKGAYAIYIGMKIVLAMGAGIIIGIASFILGLMLAIPTAGVAIVAILTGKNVGLTWNVFTITAAIVAGCIVLAIFLYVMSLVAVPAIVFFPAYSIYFLAARYRPLSLVLYPPPPGTAPRPASGPPPQEPPPLPAAPQPAG